MNVMGNSVIGLDAGENCLHYYTTRLVAVVVVVLYMPRKYSFSSSGVGLAFVTVTALLQTPLVVHTTASHQRGPAVTRYYSSSQSPSSSLTILKFESRTEHTNNT